MLKTLRKKTKVIVWTVVVSFALWGAYSVGTQFQKEGRVAGELFGKEISFLEFNRFYRASQIFSYTGKPVDDPELIRQQTWQSLMYSREAKRQNIEISDNEVRNEIERLLKADGIEVTTPEIYQQWLKRTVRETPQEFEKQVRELLRIQRLILRIHDQPAVLPSDTEIYEQFQLESQTVRLEALRFETFEQAADFYGSLKNAADWKEHIKQNASLTVIPIDTVSLAQLKRQWQIPHEEIFKLWRLTPGEISEPIKSASLYTIFHMLDKNEAARPAWDETLKEQYRKTMLEQQKYERFVEWSLALRQKALLKDYMPRQEGEKSL